MKQKLLNAVGFVLGAFVVLSAVAIGAGLAAVIALFVIVPLVVRLTRLLGI